MSHRFGNTAYGLSPEPSGDWRDYALCRYEDPETWFPVGDSGPAILQIEQAKRVCNRCPSQDECLEWAIERNIGFGIWGGVTEQERRRATVSNLSPQALAVLALAAEGVTSRHIAIRLNMSIAAVASSLKRARQQLCAADTDEAVRIAAEHGWIPAPASQPVPL